MPHRLDSAEPDRPSLERHIGPGRAEQAKMLAALGFTTRSTS